MSIKVEKKTVDNLTPRSAAWGPAFPLAQAGPPLSTPEHTNVLFSIIWYLTAMLVMILFLVALFEDSFI